MKRPQMGNVDPRASAAANFVFGAYIAEEKIKALFGPTLTKQELSWRLSRDASVRKARIFYLEPVAAYNQVQRELELADRVA